MPVLSHLRLTHLTLSVWTLLTCSSLQIFRRLSTKMRAFLLLGCALASASSTTAPASPASAVSPSILLVVMCVLARFGQQHHCAGQRPAPCPPASCLWSCASLLCFGQQHHCAGQPGQRRVPQHPACGHVRPCSRFGQQHHCAGRPASSPAVSYAMGAVITVLCATLSRW